MNVGFPRRGPVSPASRSASTCAYPRARAARDPVPQPPADQRPHLVHQTAGEHQVGALLQTLIENCCFPIQSDDRGVPAGCTDRRRRRGERLAGELDDLQGPHDPPTVGGQDRRPGGGVHPGQLGMERGHPHLGQPSFPPGPHGRVGGRKRPFVQQRLDVEHRPAHDHRDRATGRDGLDIVRGVLLIAGHRGGLGDLQDIELVVRDTAPLGDGQLRGADVHAAVELHRVGVHDFAAQLPRRPPMPECRFPGAGRPDDRDRPRHGSHSPTK